MTFGNPKRKKLDDLDSNSPGVVDIASAEKLFDLFEKHKKPSPESIKSAYARLIVGAFIVLVALSIGGSAMSSDKTEKREVAKLGGAIVLACVSAVTGFLYGSSGKS